MNPEKFLREIRKVISPQGIVVLITKNANAVLWRAVKKGSELVRIDPLVFQRWFKLPELLDMISRAGFQVMDWRGITLRPPTYIGDVNDAVALGLPKPLTELLSRITWPLENRCCRSCWLVKLCYWHLCVACRKAQK